MRSSLTILSLAAFSVAQDISVYSARADGLSQHTIYMPKTPGKIPVLVWSSGGCMRDGNFSGGMVHIQLANGGFCSQAAPSMALP
jgi:hypothetical protein